MQLLEATALGAFRFVASRLRHCKAMCTTLFATIRHSWGGNSKALLGGHFMLPWSWPRADAALVTLPLLFSFVARTRFVLVVERWVESRHSIVSRIFRDAPHASPLYLGYFVIRQVSDQLLDNCSTATLQALGEACSACRTSRKALMQFGFTQHPGIRGLLQETESQTDSLTVTDCHNQSGRVFSLSGDRDI